MATKAKGKKPKAEEKKYSLEDLAKIVGDLRHEDINWNYFIPEQLSVLDEKVANAVLNTEMCEDSVPATLSYALQEAMHKAKKDETLEDYFVPMLVVWRLAAYYAKHCFPQKTQFLAAPFLICSHIRRPGAMGKSLTPCGLIELSDRQMAEAINFADYASIQKIWKYAMHTHESFRKIPARDFINKFGGLEQDEIRMLYEEFAHEIPWDSAPKLIVKIEMPGQPISRVEVYHMDDIVKPNNSMSQ
jgi:hypothetical protein